MLVKQSAGAVMTGPEYFETCSKKGRGMAQRSLDLIEAMHAAAPQPISGRGIGYKLFTAGLIPSMEKKVIQRVYRLLVDAMDPNNLRDCVEEAIRELIEPIARQRCEMVDRAEQQSLRTILQNWGGSSS
jgi:hypothetical protein